uniref:Transcription factor TFIIIC triple barrel domain-containing protein n=1 Tax=Glossina palpalis gambiensis TaxID=67801 RepID=A0A1B0BRK0_9MUSC
MSDSEYEEEEFLVFADLNNQLSTTELAEEKPSIKIIGLDEKNPLAEINGNMFRGTYDFAMGTEVFFEKDLNAPPSDPLFEAVCRQKYKVFGKTNKVINFQRIYVGKPVNSDENMDEVGQPDDDHLKLNMTFEEVMKQFPSMKDL